MGGTLPERRQGSAGDTRVHGRTYTNRESETRGTRDRTVGKAVTFDTGGHLLKPATAWKKEYDMWRRLLPPCSGSARSSRVEGPGQSNCVFLPPNK